MCTNARSIMPKIDCLCSTIEQEKVDITFVSELWLKINNPLHSRELDRRLNLDGLEFFSNSRVSKRGGGVAIIVDTTKGYNGSRLQINSRVGNNSLEVVWVLVTPPTPINGVDKFICACIYSPPRSKLDDVILEHLRFNLSSLKAKHPRAGIIIGGDINKLPCHKICDTFPDLVNLVTEPTRGNKTLDVLISNLHPEYDKAVVLPPLQPDVV